MTMGWMVKPVSGESTSVGLVIGRTNSAWAAPAATNEANTTPAMRFMR